MVPSSGKKMKRKFINIFLRIFGIVNKIYANTMVLKVSLIIIINKRAKLCPNENQEIDKEITKNKFQY